MNDLLFISDDEMEMEVDLEPPNFNYLSSDDEYVFYQDFEI